MTQIVFIRHAESQMNAEFPHLVGGRSNHTPLTEKGHRQARLLGLRLRRQNFHADQWFVSPAVRTQNTADIVRAILNTETPMTIEDTIQELAQGEWEGKPRLEVYTPDYYAQIKQDIWNFAPPGGETQRATEKRMTDFADNCRMLYPNKTIAVVTHGMAVKCFIRGVQGWDPSKTYDIGLENTGLTIVDYSEKRQGWRLVTMNDHAHLLQPN